VWQYRLLQRRCSWQMSLLLRYQSLHVPHFATKTGVASAYISMTMNVATTSYCHAWQRTTMIARNPNTCNAKLATVANTLLQRDFLQPLATNLICLQLLPFATKLGLLQHFFIVAQGLEVSSHTPPQRNRHPRRPNTPSTEQTINKNVPS
jgi:hypothetical protein